MLDFPQFAGSYGGGGNRTRVGSTPETVVLQELRWACDQACLDQQDYLYEFAACVRAERSQLLEGADTRLYIVFDADAAKIGIADNPSKRARHLQISNPRPLILYAHAPATKALEQFLHQILWAHHIHGEWFRATPPLMAVAALIYSAQEMTDDMDANECGPCDVEDTVSILARDLMLEALELWAA